MNTLKATLFLLFSACFSFVFSQEETELKKFRFAIDLGMDLPNNQYAQFLDGSHPFGVSRVLTNPQIRQKLQNQFGHPIKGWEYSGNNQYSASFFSGVYLGFDVSSSWSVIMKFDLSIIRFSTPLIIELDNPRNFTGEFERAQVNARERRFGYKLGVQKNIEIQPKLTYYLAPGLGFNYIQLENQELVIRSASYDITRIQNAGLSLQRVDGFGYGFFFDNGLTFLLNEKFTIALGIEGRLTKNSQYVENLTEGTLYLSQNIERAKRFVPSFGAYLRLLWN